MSLSMLLLLPALFVAASNAAILNLEEGEECKALGGGKGICRSLDQCPEAGDFKVNQPPICRFKGRTPIICCPRQVTAKQIFRRKVQAYCEGMELKFRKQWTRPLLPADQAECDIFLKSGNALHTSKVDESVPTEVTETTTSGLDQDGTLHVVGGIEALPRQHSYMALVGHGDSLKDVDWSCGGSLISTEYVLSAAHCANLASRGPARWARVGDLDISSSNEDAQPQDRKIVSIILHPNYKEPIIYNDIVLFKLDSPVVFTPWVFPICLHSEPQLTHEIATITGWGRTGFVEGTSSKLLEADLKVYNDTECRRLMDQKDSKTPQGIDEKLMFCAGLPDGSKDACSGDSGGPLTVKMPGQCTKMQVGITSYGRQCGLPDAPGVYTRVSSYIDWIEKIAFIDYNLT